MPRIYLSLGSNVDRAISISQALTELEAVFGPLEISPIYESSAEGFDGDPFWNLAVGCATQLSPGAVDRELKSIEAKLGRQREGQPKFSDRTIDIDLILYGGQTGMIDGITLPRDEIDRYPFVLKPILDLLPHGVHPVSKEPFAELWRTMASASKTQLSLQTAPLQKSACNLCIASDDDFPLAATLYPAGPEIIIVNSATAVPRQLYRRFAQHSQAAGFTVLTWDYRGVGNSRPSSLRGLKASMVDWVLRDMHSVIEWVRDTLHCDQLSLLGHSAGGQLPGLLANSSWIDKMLTISAQRW